MFRLDVHVAALAMAIATSIAFAVVSYDVSWHVAQSFFSLIVVEAHARRRMKRGPRERVEGDVDERGVLRQVQHVRVVPRTRRRAEEMGVASSKPASCGVRGGATEAAFAVHGPWWRSPSREATNRSDSRFACADGRPSRKASATAGGLQRRRRRRVFPSFERDGSSHLLAKGAAGSVHATRITSCDVDKDIVVIVVIIINVVVVGPSLQRRNSLPSEEKKLPWGWMSRRLSRPMGFGFDWKGIRVRTRGRPLSNPK